jgi:DNA-binding MarR family transcriptional regulator
MAAARPSTVSAASARARRDAIAQQILELLPRLRRKFELAVPGELREELASVTVHQMEALCHLIGSGGMTMNELAQAQSIGLSSATALADRLLRQGLAQRTSDPGDRRVVRLVPTDTATELVQRFTSAKRRIAMQTLAALDDHEATTLLALLTKMVDAPRGGDCTENARG